MSGLVPAVLATALPASGNESGVLVAQSGSWEGLPLDSHRHVLALEIRTLVPFVQMTERTTTHAYPREEIRAMTEFYGGKTCVLTRNRLTVHWAHMLDAALSTSNQGVHTFHLQLSSMLTLKIQLISFNGC
jgi:hypothetical protein